MSRAVTGNDLREASADGAVMSRFCGACDGSPAELSWPQTNTSARARGTSRCARTPAPALGHQTKRVCTLHETHVCQGVEMREDIQEKCVFFSGHLG
ncbi:hypothetical protein AAFF_G00264820 [Aldrovandia affinis]|uniref:Uncharacterized protein n=1 Tax=Aldrovandia affinis TaxID=143900 RepID=A0AAD7W1Z6_9TELE|nr:hypothetical protein AAFF_G00264820 [Aldrovandia affinis]